MVSTATTATTISSSANTLKQPKGLYNLFFVELWERYGFYCVQSLLVLYLSKVHHLSDTQSYDLFSAFSTLIMATPVIGGYLADRLIGFRRSVLLGAILFTLGYFALATTSPLLFYPALALQICGNGFFKGCVSSLLGTLYEGENDPRRDSGFTIFYMGINIGALLAPLISAWLATKYGWGYGFASAGVGMLIGLAAVIIGFRKFAHHGLPPDPIRLKQPIFLGISRQTLFYIGTIIAIALSIVLIDHASFVDRAFDVFVVFIVIALGFFIFRYDNEQRKKMFLLLILMVFSILFWALYNQTFSSLTLFTDRIIVRQVPFVGWTIPTAMYESVNSFFIIILSPILAVLWMRMSGSRWNPSTPMKFALGLLFLSIGFLMLPVGIHFAYANGMVSQSWLNLCYFFQTVGELCLSPTGLAMVTALAPPNLTGMMMGVWFLTIAAGYAIGDYIADLASIPSNVTDLHTMNAIYGHTFGQFGWITLIVSIVLIALVPWLKRMTGEYR